MGQRAITDYDELNHHDNEITNILEGAACRSSTRSRRTGTTARKSGGGCR
jgi:hypothetical protein